MAVDAAFICPAKEGFFMQAKSLGEDCGANVTDRAGRLDCRFNFGFGAHGDGWGQVCPDAPNKAYFPKQ